jgi:hypothetical protein
MPTSTKGIKIIRKAMIWISAIALLYLLTNANSPFYIASILPYLNIDLSFLTVPFVALFVLLFAASTPSILIAQKSWKEATQKALYGLAVATFVLVFFKWAPLPAFATGILFPLELTISVSTGAIIIVDLLEHRRRYELLITALCTGVVAYAIYAMGTVLSQVHESILQAVLPFAMGLLAVSGGAIFGLVEDLDKQVISRISGWVSRGPVRNFTVGFSFAIYVNFVRPPVESFPPTIIGEWIAIASMMAVALNVARRPSERPMKDGNLDWKKHASEAQRQTGHAFQHLVSAQERFVTRGLKEHLLVYLTLSLRDLGKTEERILITLAPLMQYRDKETSFWSPPWTKKRLKRENENIRRKLLESLILEIERGG